MKNAFPCNFLVTRECRTAPKRCWWLACLILFCLFSYCCRTHAADADNVSYVSALQGVNLREIPSSTGRVMMKLNYGTPVTAVVENGVAVPYEMHFFPRVSNSASDANNDPVLRGVWIKVKANDQQGYVFNKLLLPYPPIKKDEGLENYFVRIFNLGAIKAKPKDNHEGVEEKSYGSNSARKITLTTDLYTQSSGTSAELHIADMSFDEAFVLVNAIFPPQLKSSYTYRKATRFEYQSDDGGFAVLETEKGGVSLVWGFEP